MTSKPLFAAALMILVAGCEAPAADVSSAGQPEQLTELVVATNEGAIVALFEAPIKGSWLGGAARNELEVRVKLDGSAERVVFQALVPAKAGWRWVGEMAHVPEPRSVHEPPPASHDINGSSFTYQGKLTGTPMPSTIVFLVAAERPENLTLAVSARGISQGGPARLVEPMRSIEGGFTAGVGYVDTWSTLLPFQETVMGSAGDVTVSAGGFEHNSGGTYAVRATPREQDTQYLFLRWNSLLARPGSSISFSATGPGVNCHFEWTHTGPLTDSPRELVYWAGTGQAPIQVQADIESRPGHGRIVAELVMLATDFDLNELLDAPILGSNLGVYTDECPSDTPAFAGSFSFD